MRWSLRPAPLQLEPEKTMVIHVNTTVGMVGPLVKVKRAVVLFAEAGSAFELLEGQRPKLVTGVVSGALPEPLRWDTIVPRIAVNAAKKLVVVQRETDLAWYCLAACTLKET